MPKLFGDLSYEMDPVTGAYKPVPAPQRAMPQQVQGSGDRGSDYLFRQGTPPAPTDSNPYFGLARSGMQHPDPLMAGISRTVAEDRARRAGVASDFRDRTAPFDVQIGRSVQREPVHRNWTRDEIQAQYAASPTRIHPDAWKDLAKMEKAAKAAETQSIADLDSQIAALRAKRQELMRAGKKSK